MLIKGVKYACERCIRGHRVSTCTHTDEPLTMIKRKGRPATQCNHCRENRKSKNLHVTCTCGKKGKNGTHLPSCGCHKTNHCTCSTNMNKKPTTKADPHHMTPSEKAKKKSIIDAANADLKKRSDSVSTTQSTPSDSSPGSVTSPSTKVATPHVQVPLSLPDQPQNPTAYSTLLSKNLVIEDIALPFETTNNGLFDLFSPGQPSEVGTNDSQVNLVNGESNNSTPNGGTSQNAISNGAALRKEPLLLLSPAEGDVDHMFPLFPLVGTQSFDNDNQPLLAVKVPQQPTPIRPGVSAINEINSNYNSPLPSTIDNSSNGHSQPRPKRPESVLSITSNSSTRSFDFFGNTHSYHNSSFLNGSLPTSSTSAAYPPSSGLEDHNQVNNVNDGNDDHYAHNHFGPTGLGSTKFGSQLSKIESEMYTDNFFDDPYTSQLDNNEPPELSVTSSINNLYNVREAYGSGTFNLVNDSEVPIINGNDSFNGNLEGATLGLANPFMTSSSMQNLYDGQDIVHESAFDYFMPNTLQVNGNNQEHDKEE